MIHARHSLEINVSNNNPDPRSTETEGIEADPRKTTAEGVGDNDDVDARLSSAGSYNAASASESERYLKNGVVEKVDYKVLFINKFY